VSISALPAGDAHYQAREFGTGLRDRLEVVRALAAAQAEKPRPAPRRDVSPELVLVSPESDPGYGEGLAELLLDRVIDSRRAPLGTLLAEAGLLEAAEIDFALTRAQEGGKRLGEVLVEHGLVTPEEVLRLVAEQRGLPFLDLRTVSVDPAAARLLPADLARLFLTLPVGFVRGLPVVAVADPTDEGAMNGARSVLHSVRFVASPEDAILAQFARVYVPGSSLHAVY
jgi:hypothetical protein